MTLDWMWEQVGAALTTLGVDPANVDRRGSTIRFAVAEGIPTFVTVEPAPHGVDLFGAVALEVMTLAGDGLAAAEVAQDLDTLNRSSALGRWVWFKDGAVGRVSSLVGSSDELRFLPDLLPHLIALGSADAVRATRFTEGRWSVQDPPTNGTVSQSEALHWIYDLVSHSGGHLRLSDSARTQQRLADDAGLHIWYSAGQEFSLAETAFADFDESGQHPSVFDALSARFGGELSEHKTALADFKDGVDDPTFGKGSLVGLRFPQPLPEPYGWLGVQALNTLTGSQLLLGLGAWSLEYIDDRDFPRYDCFVPSGVIAKLPEESKGALAESLVRDAAAQVRYCARVYEAMAGTPFGEDLEPEVGRRLRRHRGPNEQALRGWMAPSNLGADVLAFLADDMLQVDSEWSVRRPHRVDWLPHHQFQSISSEPVRSPNLIGARVRIETTVASGPADRATFERLNELNRSTCLTAILRDPEGVIRLHTSQVVDEASNWWLRQWLADIAVFHLAVSDELAVASARGEMPGWESDAYEHPESGAREEADDILNAIHVLREHSTNCALNFDQGLLTAVAQLPNLTVTSSIAPESNETSSRMMAKLEPTGWPGAFRVDLAPEEHELLGPGLRVVVSPAAPTPVTPADVSEANLRLASSESGLWMPLMVESDGTLSSSTYVPACVTRGLEEDTVAELMGRLLLEGCGTIHESALTAT